MEARSYVDFSDVKPEHRAIDLRLTNWGRWNHSSGHSAVSPMFRLYRAPGHWDRLIMTTPVDQADARRIQWAMQYLMVPQRLALAWAYIYGFVSPGKTARAMDVSLTELQAHIEDGRQALLSRGV